ncbi:hypothetical protein ACU6UL_10440, partial [Enterococcus faecium]
FPTPQVFSLVYAYRRKNEYNLTQFIYFCKRSAKKVCFFILPLFSYLLGEKIRLNSKKSEDTI